MQSNSQMLTENTVLQEIDEDDNNLMDLTFNTLIYNVKMVKLIFIIAK